ncbi:MAG: peptide chain release factor N(5)-glutamine methyltransferase [Pseudomonadota bacterium]
MRFAEALAAARAALSGSPTAALDARVLLGCAAGLDRAQLIARERDAIGDLAADYAALVDRRAAGEPVAYITGEQEFFGLPFKVNPDVLIPRPESEMLVEAAIAAKPSAFLDLGTGSGCLLIAALNALPQAAGLGIDISDAALGIAQANAQHLGVEGRAQWLRTTFRQVATELTHGPFDVILANPPYIPEGTDLPQSVQGFEPHSALFSGRDGLQAHHEVAQVIAAKLKNSGAAFIEIGSDQGEAASELYSAALPHHHVSLHRDGAGLPRMLAVHGQSGL